MKPLGSFFIAASLFIPALKAEDHIWSKQGTELYLVLGNEAIGRFKPLRVNSPDHRKRLEITFKPGPEGDAIPTAKIITNTKVFPIELGQDWAQVEVLWSPNSQSVALTGGITSYTNSTRIFHITATTAQQAPLDATSTDMARTYPPCKASNADPAFCHGEEDGRDFNYATIAWTTSNTAIIMAEVPCSSSQGGIMCQIEGYELDSATGRILRRLTARQLKSQWQPKLAWNLRIPDPPERKPGS